MGIKQSGTRAGRKERNRDFQRQLKERKRLRKARAAQHARYLPKHPVVETVKATIILSPSEARDAQIDVLNKETVKELRRRCEAGNLPVRSRDTKMSMVLLLMGEHPRQQARLVEPS